MTDIQHLKDTLVPFLVTKVKGAKTVWTNAPLIRKKWKDAPDKLIERYLERFKYIAKDATYLTDLETSDSDVKTAYAERYGFSLPPRITTHFRTFHGGGGRCGIVDDHDIKGIGLTPVVTKHLDKISITYNTGSLTLKEGVMETIMSHIVDLVLPSGSVKTYGLISLGKDTGYSGRGEIDYGCLMVREPVARAAHYCPVTRHAPIKPYEISEEERLRSLFSRFKSDEEFIEFLKSFARKATETFTAARAIGLQHGSAVAPNLTLDGRWTDYATMAFVDRNTDWQVAAGQKSFTEEQKTVTETLTAMCSVYCKIHQRRINVDSVAREIDSEINHQLFESCGYVLGVPFAPGLENSREYIELFSQFEEKIDINRNILKAKAPKELRADDKVSLWLHELYDESSNSESRKLLREVVKQTKRPDHKDMKLKEFEAKCKAKAFKRCFLTMLFSQKNIGPRMEGLTDENAKRFIDEYIHAANWIFKESYEGTETLYDDPCTIIFINNEGKYEIWWTKGQKEFASMGALCNYLDKHSVPLTYLGYDFRPYLLEMAD